MEEQNGTVDSFESSFTDRQLPLHAPKPPCQVLPSYDPMYLLATCFATVIPLFAQLCQIHI